MYCFVSVFAKLIGSSPKPSKNFVGDLKFKRHNMLGQHYVLLRNMQPEREVSGGVVQGFYVFVFWFCFVIF